MEYRVIRSLSIIITTIFVVLLFHSVLFTSAANLIRNNVEASQPVELKYTEFCMTQGDGYFPQPHNCHRYLTCTNIIEIERDCPTCLQEDAPRGKYCCGGRTCWNQTKVNEGVCEWCNDCKCSPGMA